MVISRYIKACVIIGTLISFSSFAEELPEKIGLAESHERCVMLHQELKRTQQAKEDLYDQVITLKALIGVLEQSSKGTQAQLSNKKDELDSLRQNYCSLEEHMQETISRFSERLKRESAKTSELDLQLVEALEKAKYEKSQKTQLQEQVRLAQDRFNDNENLIEKLKSEIRQTSQIVTSREKELDSLKGELSEANAYNSELYSHLDEVENQLVQQVEANELIEAKVKRNHGILEDTQSQLNHLQVALKSEKSHCESLQMELEDLMTENCQLQTVVKEASLLEQRLNQRLEDSFVRLSEISKELESSKQHSQGLEDRLATMEHEKNTLRNEFNSLEELYASRSIDEEILSKEWEKERLQHSQLLAVMEKEIEEVTKALRISQNEIAKSSQEVKGKNTQIQNFSQQLAAEQERASSLQNLLLTSERYSKEIQAALDKKDNEYERFHRQLAKAEKEKTQLTSRLNEVSKNYKATRAELANALGENEALKSVVNSYQDEIGSLKLTLLEEQESEIRLKHRLDVAFEKLKTQTEEQSNSEYEYTAIHDENESLKSTNTQLLAQIEQGYESLKNEKARLRKLEGELEVSNEKLFETQSSLARVKGELSSQLRQVTASLDAEKSKSCRLKELVEGCQANKGHSQAEVSKLVRELEARKRDVTRLNNLYTKAQARHEAKLKEMQVALKKEYEKNCLLAKELNQSENGQQEEVEVACRRIEALERDLSKQQEKYGQQLKELNSELIVERNKNKNFDKENNQVELLVASYEKEKTELVHMLAEAKQLLEQKDSELHQVSHRLIDANKSLAKNQKAIRTAKTLEDKLIKTEKQLARKKEELNALHKIQTSSKRAVAAKKPSRKSTYVSIKSPKAPQKYNDDIAEVTPRRTFKKWSRDET